MAIRAIAGESLLAFRNTDRELATPPVVFPDLGMDFGCSIWVWCGNPNIPIRLLEYQGQHGFVLSLDSEGGSWYVTLWMGGAPVGPRILVAGVGTSNWQVFCMTKVGTNLLIYGAGEASLTTPIVLSLLATMPFFGSTTDAFLQFVVKTSVNYAICNFKFWNRSVTGPDFQEHVNSWLATGNAPIWACPLRTPGDMASIVNPYTSTDWDAGHNWYPITDRSNYTTYPDPGYLNTQPCLTWIYPIFGNPRPIVSVNPNTTPAVPTVYKGTIFYAFDDRGSVPITPNVPFFTCTYFGFPYKTGTGVGPTDTWGLYLDELGNEKPIQTGAAFRFEADTGIAVAGVASDTFYAWQFSAQFTYPGQTPAVPTATGNLSYIMLLIQYQGTPTGIPGLPPNDLTGLFAINKGGPPVDRYNRGRTFKIPNPTIRTALIGE